MSFVQTAEGWVLKLAREREDLTPSELHVLIVLAARHNRDFHAAHPKRELMAKETHYSQRQIQRILRSCEAKGVLDVSRGELPTIGTAGRRVYGTVCRFVGLDPVPSRGDKMSTSRGDTGGSHGETPEATTGRHPSRDHGETSANSPLRNPERPPTGVEPGREPVRAIRASHGPDAAAPRAVDGGDGDGQVVPPRWEELAPGVIRGRADGQGEVRLLRVRCPQCERALQPDELDDHQCEPVQRNLLHPTPARVNNLSGHFRRARRREGDRPDRPPPEVLAELQAMEQQRAGRVVTLPPEELERHERLVEAERIKKAAEKAEKEAAKT